MDNDIIFMKSEIDISRDNTNYLVASQFDLHSWIPSNEAAGAAAKEFPTSKNQLLKSIIFRWILANVSQQQAT